MPDGVNFIIITGMSGAGKSQALNCLEDFGFFCVDNLPLAILPKFIELTRSLKDKFKKVALGIDIREGDFFKNFHNSLGSLTAVGIKYKIIFLEADDLVLLRRYSETRRRHPLGSNILAGIRKERKILSVIKSGSDKVINTSNLTLNELKETIHLFVDNRKKAVTRLQVISFGYKYGVPMDSDIVFDVRFLPNPNYVDSLRYKTGKDKRVKKYILKVKNSRIFLEKLKDLFKFLLPLYMKEGKSYLTIAIGCTGGRHRSVFVAEQFGHILKSLGYNPLLKHRDIKK